MSHGLATFTKEALAREYATSPAEFKEKALARLIPDAVHGLAVACRGDAPFHRPQRWAVRLALEVAKWVGAQGQVNVQLTQVQAQLNEARPAHEAMLNAANMSHGERRAALIGALARMEGVPESMVAAALARLRADAVPHVNGNAHG